jgi:hypothetical protein
MRILADIVQGNLTPPHEAETRVPEQISRACMIALALEPEQRFQGARAFAQRLRSAALLDHVEVATEEAVCEFVRSCGVHEHARRQNARLENDEETVVEAPPPRAREPAKTRTGRSTKLVWFAAAVALAGLVSWPLLSTHLGASPNRAQLPPGATPHLAVDPPLPPEPVPNSEELARAEAPPATDGDESPESARKRTSHRSPKPRMYHPRGL